MKAIVVQEGKKVAVEEKEIPTIKEDEVLVKVIAAAINPTDWKHVHLLGVPPGVIVGCDYSGVVQKVGEKVSHLKFGDRIGGFVHGSIHQHTGAFAEYVAGTADITYHKPDHFSHEENATLCVGGLTASGCLYHRLGLPTPSSPLTTPAYLLVWSGATSVGQYAVQLAKLSGFKVITTSSPNNFNLLRSLGADHCFDYRDPDVVKKIKEASENKLEYGVDCVSTEESLTKGIESMGEKGGKIAAILYTVVNHERKDVIIERELLYLALGEAFEVAGKKFPAVPEDRAFMANFIKKEFEPLLKEKKLKPNVIRRGEGLSGIIEGLEYIKAGKVSAEKLVYHIQNE